MGAFAIESGIPRRHGNQRYPFNAMSVGDSFFVPGDARSSNAVKAAASSYGTRNGWKFASNETRDGCRIWRTA